MKTTGKYTLYITFVICALLSSSCHKDDDKIYEPIDEISASEINLIPDKATKTVSTILNFKNLETIDYLSVIKSGGDDYSIKINRSELLLSYVFKYIIKKSDPESFNLILKAYYKNGNASQQLSLNIDNRWGFFIRNVSRIARVIGTAISGETFPSPNNTAVKWNVGGTDLGIIWEKCENISFLSYSYFGQGGYFNGDRYNITMRIAEEITGPWSNPYELAAGKEYAQLYGSYFHPLSVSGNNLYFLMSMWMPYNVFLMKTELADMGNFSD